MLAGRRHLRRFHPIPLRNLCYASHATRGALEDSSRNLYLMARPGNRAGHILGAWVSDGPRHQTLLCNGGDENEVTHRRWGEECGRLKSLGHIFNFRSDLRS